MLSGFVTSLIRTGSSYAVAWLLSLKFAGPVLEATGVDSATAKERMTALFVFTLGTAWYFVVRLAEHRWPQIGVLLGVPAKPTYGPAEDTGDGTVPAIEPSTVDVVAKDTSAGPLSAVADAAATGPEATPPAAA
jgi:hypothetical protein